MRLDFDPVGDPVHDRGAFLNGGLAPGVFRLVSRIERQLDIRRRGARDLAEFLARDRAWIVEVPAFDRGNPFASDEVVIPVSDQDLARDLLDGLLKHGVPPFCYWRRSASVLASFEGEAKS